MSTNWIYFFDSNFSYILKVATTKWSLFLVVPAPISPTFQWCRQLTIPPSKYMSNWLLVSATYSTNFRLKKINATCSQFILLTFLKAFFKYFFLSFESWIMEKNYSLKLVCHARTIIKLFFITKLINVMV